MDLLWVAGLLVFLVSFLVGYAEVPSWWHVLVSSVSPMLLAVMCALACYIFWNEYRPPHLYFFMVAMLLWALAETVWLSAEYVEEIAPSYADVLWLAGYPLLAVGFIGYIRKNRISADSVVLTTIVAVSVVYAAVFLKYMLPIGADFESIVNMLYPLGDVVLLALSSYVVLGKGKNGCFAGIGWSMLLFTIFDSLYAYTLKMGTYEKLMPFIDPLYLLAYLVFLYAVYSRYRDIAGQKESVAFTRARKRASRFRQR